MPDRSTVYIVDDNKAVLLSLTLLLTTEGYAVRAHESARTFLETIRQDDSGCVVTDVRMPEIDGLDLLAMMKERRISMPVIVITGHGTIPLAVTAVKRGAVDFFEKPLDGNALLASIRAALTRGGREHTQMIRERFAILSKREKEVLAGLVKGQPNRNIAHELGISPRTVEVHRANVMAKMQATGVAELVKMAMSCNTGRVKPSHDSAVLPRSKPDTGFQTSNFND
jgi:two-component system response regulator FixJ